MTVTIHNQIQLKSKLKVNCVFLNIELQGKFNNIAL